ncbi:hypothetical protein LCGC14_1065350 [marine sediment metagenome]|uniref:Uncharacterized protein n=1 Tax=marine sediment metagenome TaxID=412755 RepID=A0A0F9MPL9_9ZZZZ
MVIQTLSAPSRILCYRGQDNLNLIFIFKSNIYFQNGAFTKKKAGRWVTELKKVYNRGFTPGFYFKRVTEEDHQHKSPTNLSHYRYIEVGWVEEFDPITKYASISLDNGYLSLNDDLILMGKKTDTYVHQKAKKIKYKGNIVKKTPRGTKNKKVLIELKVEDVVLGNGQDKIYVFTDKTYGNEYVLP